MNWIVIFLSGGLSVTVLFVSASNPLAMGLLLLFQILMVTVVSGSVSSLWWFSYILFLIFIGGVMVLFMYIASLAPNKSYKPALTNFFISGSILMAGLFLMFVSDSTLASFDIKLGGVSFSEGGLVELVSGGLYGGGALPLIYSILYLLFTLLVVVSLVSVGGGPLRTLIK